MISLLLILSFYRSVLLRTTIYVKQRRWRPGRVDPLLHVLFSKLATYLTCSSYSKCIISFSSNDCFTTLIYTCNKFYATALKVIFTIFTIFLQIFIFMILQHDTKSQVV